MKSFLTTTTTTTPKQDQSQTDTGSNNFYFENMTLLCNVEERALMEEARPTCVINSIFASILNGLVPFHKAKSVGEDEQSNNI